MSLKKFFQKTITIIVLVALGVMSINVFASPKESKKVATTEKNVKNIILIVPDGAGLPYYTAYRYYHDNPSKTGLDETVFDPYFSGVIKTISDTSDENITDSAAAATAMATGVKTYNNAIGVDVHKKPVKSVLEQAKEKGMATGIVVTSEINHATPAGFVAHNEYRKNMEEIADSYFDERIKGEHKVDVMLGGGLTYFERSDRNIVSEFKKVGYNVVKNKDELKANTNTKLLGLFADKGLPPAIDRPKKTPSLVEMAKEAIKQLQKNDKGFFLLIEESQIDWAAHDNDVVYAMSEMNEFGNVFSYVINWAKKNGQTQVIAAADHSSGGLTIGADGVYDWDASVIKSLKRTPNYIATQIAKGANVEKTLKQYTNLKLNSDEMKSINNVVNEAGRDDSSLYNSVDSALEKIINHRSHSGFTTTGHTGEEVPFYTYGPLSDELKGVIDNTDIAKVIFKALE